MSTHLTLAATYIHNIITQQGVDVQVTARNVASERAREIQTVNAEVERLKRTQDKHLKYTKELQGQVQILATVLVVLVVGVIAVACYIFKSSS